MPVNKDALVRYRVINKCLTNRFKKYPSKEEICEACAEALGCNTISTRTFDKDVEDMRYDEELGYFAPISYDRLKKGYYYTDPSYSIDKIPLNSEEVNALQFAVSLLDQLKHIPLMGQFTGAVDKIVDAFNLNRMNKPNEEVDFIEFENPAYIPGGHLLSNLVEAVKEKMVIQFSYKKHGESLSKHYLMDPYLLKEFRNRWYIIGKESQSKEIRIFGLDRILELEILNDYFEQDPSFDKDKFFKHSFGITSVQDKPVEIILSFNPKEGDYIKSLPLHHSQKVILDNKEECRISLYVYPTYELITQILAYGKNVRVLSPESIREEIIAIFKETLKNYQK
ncbi:MAG: helix-turn-helix transcriptional regulator [Cytophagaceae bacterium]